MFGRLIPLPRDNSLGNRMPVLENVAAFDLPVRKAFVKKKCPVDGKTFVFVSGTVKGEGLSADLEKGAVVNFVFEDAQKNILKAGYLSNSPIFGEYIYVTIGAKSPLPFKTIAPVPKGAVSLTLGFMRWAAKGRVTVSNLKVTALVQ